MRRPTIHNDLVLYSELLDKIKTRIRQGQVRAVLSANAEMIRIYWDVGQMICERQVQAGWGTGVLPRLAQDLHNQISEIKGFSVRNLKLMTQFYREYSDVFLIGQQPVAQLAKFCQFPKGQHVVAQIPWGHNIILMQKIKDKAIRFWYMQKTIEQGWSRDILALMIKGEVHKREGKAISNFNKRLPSPQSDLVQQTLKDPYVFDFLTLEEPFHECELETSLVRHLEKFLVELGQGFAFVGRQYHVDVGEHDFYIDLLFYHLRLRCFIVIELKKGPFKPDYAGKMNFYCNVIDDCLRHEVDNATIGLILCQDREKVLAEYSLRSIKKPIGVSQYELTRALPKKLISSLPTIEQIEEELSVRKGRKKKSNV